MLFGSVLEALGHGVRRRMTGAVAGDGGRPGRRRAEHRRGARARVARRRRWRCRRPRRSGLRDDIQRSSILRALNDVLPPSGPILNALARFDPFPRIDGPAGRPARAARGDRPRPRRARRGRAAWSRSRGRPAAWGSRARAGSPRDGLVVTNAHVVAGQQRHDGPARRRRARPAAHAVVFDPHDDIAILRVDGLGGRALPIASEPAQRRFGRRSSASRRTGPTTCAPARLGSTRTVITQDAYGRGPGPAIDRHPARHRAPGQLGRPGGRRARARGGDRVRRRRAAARAAATACPTRSSSATSGRAEPAASVSTGACAG